MQLLMLHLFLVNSFFHRLSGIRDAKEYECQTVHSAMWVSLLWTINTFFIYCNMLFLLISWALMDKKWDGVLLWPIHLCSTVVWLGTIRINMFHGLIGKIPPGMALHTNFVICYKPREYFVILLLSLRHPSVTHLYTHLYAKWGHKMHMSPHLSMVCGLSGLHPDTATPRDHLKQLCPFHFTASMGWDRIKIFGAEIFAEYFSHWVKECRQFPWQHLDFKTRLYNPSEKDIDLYWKPRPHMIFKIR